MRERKRQYIDPEARCVVMGQLGCDLHHIKTRGAGGTDAPFNLIPLSHHLHVEWHVRGTSFMAAKYMEIHLWLLHHGWHLCEVREKWIHEAKEEEKEA